MDRDKLIQYVKQRHSGQFRKYTNAPYYTHVEAVAISAENYGVRLGFEIGLCHDLLEDTIARPSDILKKLLKYEYTNADAEFIAGVVIELTDIFTNESCPYLNRKIRKQCEALRLHTISREAQIIKCCDLMDNTSSIVQHDPAFAVKYLAEKREILKGFKKIDGKIKSDVWNCLLAAEKLLDGYEEKEL